MAIADLTKVEVVLPKDDLDSALSGLERSGLLHVDDIHDGLDAELAEHEAQQPAAGAGAAGRQADIDFLLQLFQRFAPIKKGLLEEFFGSPPPRTRTQLTHLVDSVDVADLRARLGAELTHYDELLSEQALLRQRRSNLEPWEPLGVSLVDLSAGRHTTLLPVRMPGGADALTAAVGDGSLGPSAAYAPVSAGKRESYGVLAVLNEQLADAQDGLRRLRGEVVDLPVDDLTPAAALRATDARVAEIDGLLTELRRRFVTASERYRGALLAHADAASGKRAEQEARRRLYYSKRAAVLTGWVRSEHADPLRVVLSQTCPGARARFSAPETADDPPVDLNNRTLIRPFEFLIRMFGMPKYFGIDPTPFVAVAMTLFYALALGDAGYGFLQVLLCLWLMRRYESAGETRLFLRMFVITGIASIVVGVLTWSFFGESPGIDDGKILGFLPLITPTEDIVPLMALTIGIGVVLQLASIVAGVVDLWKSGQRLDAFLQRGTWLALLVALILWIAVRAAGASALDVPATVLLAVAAAAVILFSVRTGGSIGRVLTGILSLYGIVGYYGLVAFFSDVLSYMRLGILALTSAFIGKVGNLMGSLFFAAEGGATMVIGVLIGVIIIVLFHVLNLVLSMLGAFVHSLRLNYLESFQRYFDGGGRAFSPMRGEAKHYRIIDTIMNR
ncbi:MAG: hypothetical protein OXC31_23525 [Spirochaetaceae bacterium]|nr:hypothetical protein [Spirochaetaceae bacterium]